MQKVMFVAIFAISLVVGSAGIQADEEEYIPFTDDELKDLLVGNTYPLVKGGFYFPDETRLIALWDGEVEETTWEITDESTICYSLELFGGYECISLFKRSPDLLIQVYEDYERVWKLSDVKPGKQF